jgi:hypothetical protein
MRHGNRPWSLARSTAPQSGEVLFDLEIGVRAYCQFE